MSVFGLGFVGGTQLIGVSYKMEIWSDRKERFLNIAFVKISGGKLMTKTNIFERVSRSSVVNFFPDIPHAILKFQVLPAIGSFIVSPLPAITTCFSGIPLLKRILLLCYTSKDRNYFPWDISALSLLIFVLSPQHCFTVHLIVFSVPSVDDSLNQGQTQSITSVCNNDHTSNALNQKPVLKDNTQNCNAENVRFKKLKPVTMTSYYEDPCIQIHACNCSGRDSNMTGLNSDAWLHCKFRPQVNLKCLKDCCSVAVRAMFLIYLLSTSLIPIVAAQTSNTSDELHSTVFPRSRIRLFCDQYPLENLLSQKDIQECVSNRCDHKDGYDCCDPIKMLAERDEEAKADFDDFLSVILKYAASMTYSVQWPMKCCKTAYKNWVCSTYHQYYDVGKGENVTKEACPSICIRVERSCPFFRVHNNTKLYGGQPTFLCRGFRESNPVRPRSCHDMSSSTCHPNFQHNTPDQSDTEQNSTLQAFNAKQAHPGIGNSKRSSNSTSSASTCCFSVLFNLLLYVLLYHFLQCR